MENILMNEIMIDTCTLPAALSGAYQVASAPFIHADRTANFHVLIYVTEGHISVTEEDTDYLIQKEELFFLKSGLHHYGKSLIPQGTAWYFIHFRTQEPHLSCQPFQIRHEPGNQGLISTDASYLLPLPKHISVPEHSRTAKMIIQYINYINSTDPLRRWNLNPKLFELLSECAFHARHALPETESLSDQICRFLGEQVQTPFSSTLLETQFHLSYKHMAACFKKSTGMSMQAYHTRLKMNLACKLLRSTLLSVKEISLQLGYQDMLYFSRVFHASIGISPSNYRKQVWI
ncbi:MAG: AraC family transcriptional regulator [Lachnospiraceae bacterium]|nr:AraC family transcriptional regulator [Lachnospiraceae bacterium]